LSQKLGRNLSPKLGGKLHSISFPDLGDRSHCTPSHSAGHPWYSIYQPHRDGRLNWPWR